MKLRISRNKCAVVAATLCLFICSSCGTGSIKTEIAEGAVASPSPGSGSSVGSDTTPAAGTPTENLAAKEGSNHPAQTEKRRNEPQPEIGPGGNDFFLFTKTRAALDADSDLKTTNIIVEVKKGILTLNGEVPNAALRMKAEQLMRGVEGVKEVKNRLRISS